MSSFTGMIGVVGGGQLARMLVEAANERAIPVSVQTTSADDPAAELSQRLVAADPRMWLEPASWWRAATASPSKTNGSISTP